MSEVRIQRMIDTDPAGYAAIVAELRSGRSIREIAARLRLRSSTVRGAAIREKIIGWHRPARKGACA